MMQKSNGEVLKGMSLIRILNGIYEQYIPPNYTYQVCLTVYHIEKR